MGGIAGCNAVTDQQLQSSIDRALAREEKQRLQRLGISQKNLDHLEKPDIGGLAVLQSIIEKSVDDRARVQSIALAVKMAAWEKPKESVVNQTNIQVNISSEADVARQKLARLLGRQTTQDTIEVNQSAEGEVAE